MPGIAERASVFTMESVNLICSVMGNQAQPGHSTHLSLQELKLPALEENYVDFLPGGALVAIEVETHINKLACTFTLNGWQPPIMKLFRRNSAATHVFFAYGVIRDHRTGAPLQAQAEIWGRLGTVNPTAFRKGDLMNHEYAIRGITHYHLRMQLPPADGSQVGTGELSDIYYWDFFEPALQVDGYDVYREENRMLMIPSGGIFGEGEAFGGEIP